MNLQWRALTWAFIFVLISGCSAAENPESAEPSDPTDVSVTDPSAPADDSDDASDASDTDDTSTTDPSESSDPVSESDPTDALEFVETAFLMRARTVTTRTPRPRTVTMERPPVPSVMPNTRASMAKSPTAAMVTLRIVTRPAMTAMPDRRSLRLWRRAVVCDANH